MSQIIEKGLQKYALKKKKSIQNKQAHFLWVLPITDHLLENIYIFYYSYDSCFYKIIINNYKEYNALFCTVYMESDWNISLHDRLHDTI